MQLHGLDLTIILLYLAGTLGLGFWLSRRATRDMRSYFLGGNTLKWYMLGLSNASGMWDISGTMWTVMILFVYGLKSAWIPWLWPVWNQVFVFVFLAAWMRRSGTMTGAQWISFRFGEGRGARLSHIIIVIFAVVSVLGFMAYFFEGIGKFCTSILPWNLSLTLGSLTVKSEQSYALIVIGITTLYTLKGGMYSVVATEVLQFVIMTLSCLVIGWIAWNGVTAEQVQAATPARWGDLGFGWDLGLDWSQTPYPGVDEKIANDGFGLFGALFMMMLFKGVFASLAGPVPSYDMQRILSTRTPSDAAKMSAATIAVMYIPRYIMVAGFAVLGLVYLQPEIAAMGKDIDFEKVLPLAINKFVPVGWKGLLLAGLLAAFMGTFAAFVNAAPAYIVNDIYRKYIRPDAPETKLIRLSILSSLLLVVIGVVFGFNASSLNTLTLWITSALYGGYACANMLKWIWWRFNGYGYFGGMLAGLLASTALLFFKQLILDALSVTDPVADIWFFPAILLFSGIGCLLGTFFAPLENFEAVKAFYKETRPWGWWGPVREAVMKDDPGFQPNRDFHRDVINILVGMVWQMAQVVIPMYLMVKDHTHLAIWTMVLFVTTWLLKKYWWDQLDEK
ncbi:MAG: Na+:solute symporter [Bacteroidetes bacterium]|nr:Na+:solute symporter [Bacteroidota bacterium]